MPRTMPWRRRRWAVFATLAALAAGLVGHGWPAWTQGGELSEGPALAEFAGRIEAARDAQISPRVAGSLTKICIEEGGQVQQGQLLFELDARPAQLALEQARAELLQAKAELAAAQADLARTQQLAATAAVSRAEVDMATAKAATVTAKTKVAETAIYAAELNLEATRIVAPIAGRAGRCMVGLGNWVQPGTVLTTVVNDDPIYVTFDVPEKTYLQLARARQAADAGPQARIAVQVGLADEQGFPHAGQLDFVDNRADPQTHTIRFRAVLANANRAMIPGLSARVRMPLASPLAPPGAAPPREALR